MRIAFPAGLIVIAALAVFFYRSNTPTSETAAAAESENYCHDQQVEQDWSRMLDDAPDDPIVLKLYALRSGLCGMVEQGLVSLDQAAELWELERAEGAVQRFNEDSAKRPARSL